MTAHSHDFRVSSKDMKVLYGVNSGIDTPTSSLLAFSPQNKTAAGRERARILLPSSHQIMPPGATFPCSSRKWQDKMDAITADTAFSSREEEDGEAANPTDILTLNVAGEGKIAVLRRTLCLVENSMLATQFSGRWDGVCPVTKTGMSLLICPANYSRPWWTFSGSNPWRPCPTRCFASRRATVPMPSWCKSETFSGWSITTA